MTQYFNRLTQGALGHILQGTKIEEPVFQMLAYKNMPTDSTKRYRLVLSDGAYTYQCCIVMGDLAFRVENNEFDRYCLLKVSRYMLNEIQSRQVIVLADPKLIVKGSKIGEKLGDPVPFGQEGAPPLSNFKANYHLNVPNNNSMDCEFDDFDDIDTIPTSKLISNNNGGSSAAKRTKNDFGNTSASGASRSTYNSSASNTTLNPHLAVPITSITPYSNKWLIKGRCTSKTNIRSWSNAKGEGTLFAFDIKDETGDLRFTAFKSECDKFYEMIKVGNVYLISKGLVKTANRQYTRTTSDYEVTCSADTIIEQCEDDTGCPSIQYDFVQINSLENHFAGFVDVIGIIKDIGEVETIITKKTNKESPKRNIIIVDQSECEVTLAVWGDQATKFTGELEDVIVVRGVKVSDFNGVSLSTTQNSTVEFNPSIDQAHSLKGWYIRCKNGLQTKNLTENKMSGGFKADWKNLNEINPENIAKEAAVTLQTKATIYQMGKTNMYKACDCNKKLVDLNNGFYRCEKCSKEVQNFNWKMIMTFAIADHTKNVWVQVFPDDAQKLLGGRDMNELGQLFENNPAEVDDLLKTLNFTSHIFKLKAKMEHFNDDARIRTQVAGVKPIDYQVYGNLLLDQIKEI